ncbi:MAG: outer membrane beta-barrel family protein [Chitinophagaceae bacterium]
MKRFYFLFALLCFATFSYSQHVIKGTVSDTTSKAKLQDVTVSVLTAADSFLYQFSYTDPSGNFQIAVPDSVPYFLLFEYPHYASFASGMEQPGKNVDMGIVPLLTKAHLLEEVVVKKRVGAMTIKGDTTEFAADSFKVQPNATVEELLKKLPGIQVDKSGNITAQGQAVKRVLVDGEEFFGDDPKLVTKNLRADVVDKVQVYDKKSDQAAFTGVSDGNDERTINLKIKEAAKHGTFGKVEVGGGTKGFYQSQGNFNQFNKSQKFSATAAVGNTSKVGLDWGNRSMNWNNDDNSNNDGEDIQTAQGGNSTLISWDGNYGDKGVPLSQFGALHYDNAYKHGTKLSGDYKINNLMIKGNTVTDNINNQSGTSLVTHSDAFFGNQSFRNKLDGRGEIYFDSAKNNSMVVNAHGQLDHRNSESHTIGNTVDGNGDKVNDNKRFLTSKGDINTFSVNMLFRHKFKKERRTFSIYLAEQYNINNNDGFLNNESNFYVNGVVDSVSNIYQRKDNNSNVLVLNAKATYSEPLSKNASLIVNYGIITSNSNADNYSFDKDANGLYNTMDSAYSNSYKFNQLMHRTGLFYYYNTKKVNFNMGSNVGFNQYTQTDKFGQSAELKRHFVNWYPQAFLRYNIQSNTRLTVSYRGSNMQPSMEQIQPLAQNTDPLNVYIGNQDLKPAYSNNLNINYNAFDIIAFSGYYFGVSGSNTLNGITTNTTTDISTGKTIYEYVNANGNYNISGYGGIFRKIRKWDANLNVFLNYNQSRNVNFVTTTGNTPEKNNSDSKSASIGFYLSKNKEKKYEIGTEASAGYNFNKTSLQAQQDNNYFTFNLNPNGNVYLTKKVKLNMDYSFSYYGKSNSFSNPYSIGIMNASISKLFFKNEGLEIRAGVNDLFNKNLNLQRTNYGNQIVQVLNSTIRRYYMLSVIWNFKTGMAGGTQ